MAGSASSSAARPNQRQGSSSLLTRKLKTAASDSCRNHCMGREVRHVIAQCHITSCHITNPNSNTAYILHAYIQYIYCTDSIIDTCAYIHTVYIHNILQTSKLRLFSTYVIGRC